MNEIRNYPLDVALLFPQNFLSGVLFAGSKNFPAIAFDFDSDRVNPRVNDSVPFGDPYLHLLSAENSLRIFLC